MPQAKDNARGQRLLPTGNLGERGANQLEEAVGVVVDFAVELSSQWPLHLPDRSSPLLLL